MKGSDNMLTLFLPDPGCNRWYVVDGKGNKLYYGTKSECRKFIKYMKGENKNAALGKG